MSNLKQSILLVEDDPGLRAQMKWILAEYQVLAAEDRASALAMFARHDPPVVILDLGLPPHADSAIEGLTTLETILSLRPQTKIIVATGNDERANALRAVAMGAYDFQQKPVESEMLRLVVSRALNLHDLEEENRQLSARSSHTGLDGVIADSPAMMQVCRQIERVASANVAVLIRGESGTGKEVVASAIHRLSPRAAAPLVAINCAAIPAALLESELFGHEKGAFTGAVRQSVGKVEQAHGGTLFLDEIGDMPIELQAKMLRFLQARVIERVGGRKEIEVDVRVLSATNRDLDESMRNGSFREDLYYRLNEVTIPLPPLRDRPGDAVLLAQYFLRKHAQGIGRAPRAFGPDAVAAIASYPWPGNVRELENRVRRAMLMADGKHIAAADLDLAATGEAAPLPSLKKIREKAENEAVERALALTGNNVTEAARLLGVSRPTLYDLMRQGDLRQGDLKQKETP